MGRFYCCVLPPGEVDPEKYEAIPWPNGLDSKHVLQDLDDKTLTYEQVRERVVEELHPNGTGRTNNALLLGFVMLEMEKMCAQSWGRIDYNAYFWDTI